MQMNKLAALLFSGLLAVSFTACGGSSSDPGAVSSGEKAQVNIEVSAQAIKLTDVKAIKVVATPGPVEATLTYNAAKNSFSGGMLVTAGNYTFDATAYSDVAATVAIGTGKASNVVVTATAVKTVTLNISSNNEPIPADGFVISGASNSGYVAADGAATTTLSVTVLTASATAPTIAWSAKVKGTTTNCAATFGTPSAASTTFGSSSTAQICEVTVKVTLGNVVQSKVFTVGVGQNVEFAGSFYPSPTITKVELLSTGGWASPVAFKTTDTVTGLPLPSFSLTKLNPAEAGCTLWRYDQNPVVVPPTWEATDIYAKDMVVRYAVDSQYYKSIADGNTGNLPTDATKWTLIGATLPPTTFANDTCPITYKINSGIPFDVAAELNLSDYAVSGGACLTAGYYGWDDPATAVVEHIDNPNTLVNELLEVCSIPTLPALAPAVVNVSAFYDVGGATDATKLRIAGVTCSDGSTPVIQNLGTTAAPKNGMSFTMPATLNASTTLCTVTVEANNNGAIDTYAAKIAFKP